MSLTIANSYGNFDATRNKVPKGYVLVQGQRLSVLCRKHRISFVSAVTGWEKFSRKYPARPVIGGVVVTAR